MGDALGEMAPEAEKAGVILAIEDTISAEDNVRIMDRAKSKNVSVYYDTGNSALAGFDVVKEIRWLGKDRICQFHLKDNPHYLGEGTHFFPAGDRSHSGYRLHWRREPRDRYPCGIHGGGGYAQEPGLHPPGDGLATTCPTPSAGQGRKRFSRRFSAARFVVGCFRGPARNDVNLDSTWTPVRASMSFGIDVGLP